MHIYVLTRPHTVIIQQCTRSMCIMHMVDCMYIKQYEGSRKKGKTPSFLFYVIFIPFMLQKLTRKSLCWPEADYNESCTALHYSIQFNQLMLHTNALCHFYGLFLSSYCIPLYAAELGASPIMPYLCHCQFDDLSSHQTIYKTMPTHTNKYLYACN